MGESTCPRCEGRRAYGGRPCALCAGAGIVNGVEDAWQNADDTGPAPSWVAEAGVVLTGGRYAIETRTGTVIAEMGDWLVRDVDGRVSVVAGEK